MLGRIIRIITGVVIGMILIVAFGILVGEFGILGLKVFGASIVLWWIIFHFAKKAKQKRLKEEKQLRASVAAKSSLAVVLDEFDRALSTAENCFRQTNYVKFWDEMENLLFFLCSRAKRCLNSIIADADDIYYNETRRRFESRLRNLESLYNKACCDFKFAQIFEGRQNARKIQEAIAEMAELTSQVISQEAEATRETISQEAEATRETISQEARVTQVVTGVSAAVIAKNISDKSREAPK